jgi:hypothetical protein
MAGLLLNQPSTLASQPVEACGAAGGALGAGVGGSAGMGAGSAGVMPLTAASWRGSFASSFSCWTRSGSSGCVTRLKLNGSGSLWLRSSWRSRSIV